MTAPKIDTQAPERIDRTTVTDFATGDETTMLTLMIDGKLDYADADGPWGQAVLALLAERDLSAAREAAAWIAGRDAAKAQCDPYGGSMTSCNCDLWIEEYCTTPPADPAAALDRLIAEARAQGLREAAKIYEDGGPVGTDSWDYFGAAYDAFIAAADSAARGRKEGRGG